MRFCKSIYLIHEPLIDFIASHVGWNVDKKAERAVIIDDGHGFFAKFVETTVKNTLVEIISAVTTIMNERGGKPAVFYVLLGNLEKNGDFDGVARLGGGSHDFFFFATPATNRGKDQRVGGQIFTVKIRKN